MFTWIFCAKKYPLVSPKIYAVAGSRCIWAWPFLKIFQTCAFPLKIAWFISIFQTNSNLSNQFRLQLCFFSISWASFSSVFDILYLLVCVHLIKFPFYHFSSMINWTLFDLALIKLPKFAHNYVWNLSVKLRSVCLNTRAFAQFSQIFGLLSHSSRSFGLFSTFWPLILDWSSRNWISFLVDAPTISRSVKTLNFNVRTVILTNGNENWNPGLVGSF